MHVRLTRVMSLAMGLAMLTLSPTNGPAADVSWVIAGPGAADWSVGTNWSTGSVPGSTDRAIVNNGGMAYLETTAGIAQFALGQTASNSGSLELRENGLLTLASGDTFVGNAGTGLLTIQSGASLTQNGGSFAVGEAVGSSGTVVQNGGTVVLAQYLNLGARAATATGRYEIHGGSLTLADAANGYLQIGREGSGVFVQTGGTVTVGRSTNSPALMVGAQGASVGRYEMSGGELHVTGEKTIIGRQNTSDGTFVQTAGTVKLADALILAQGDSTKGRWDLQGGQLFATSITKGGGTAQFNWSGGTIRPYDDSNLAISVPLVLSDTGARFDTRDLNNVARSISVTGPITGSGRLTKVHDGTLSFSTATSAFGGLRVNGGTLALTSGVEVTVTTELYIGADAGNDATLNVADGTNILFNSTGTAFAIGLSGKGAIIQTGGTVQQSDTGAMYLGYNSGAVGSYQISGGTLDQGSLSLGYNGGTSTFSQTGGAVVAQRDVRVGRGGGAHSYTISSGTLTVSNSSGTGDGVLNIGYDTSGTTATFTQSGGTVDAMAVRLAREEDVTGTYNLSVGELRTTTISAGPGTAQFNWSGGTIRPRTSGSLSVTMPLTLSGTGATFNSSDADGTARTITASAAIAGDGALTKTGAGTLILSGDNAYMGTTTVSEGALSARHNSALGSTDAGTVVSSGAALELQGGVTIADEALTITGTGVGSAGALRSASGANAWTGAVALSGNSSIGVAADTLTLSGTLSGDVLTKVGGGTLVVSTATSSIGGLSINQGEVALASGADVTLASNLYVGRYSGQNATLTVVAGTRIVVSEVDGVLFYIGTSGTGKIVQTGGTVEQNARGAMYIGNNGTYEISGGTFDQGSLSLGNGAGTGSIVQTGGDVVARRDVRMGREGGTGLYTMSGGTLTVNNFSGRENGYLNVGYNQSGSSATFTQSGGTVDAMGVQLARETGITGTYNLSGGELRTPTISAGSGTAQFNWSGGTIRPRTGGVLSVSIPLTLAGMGATFNSSDAGGTARTITVSSAIGENGGAWGLTKQGEGTLALNVANTYTGATEIIAGTLKLGAAGAIAGSSTISVAAGAVFDVADVSGGFSVAIRQTLSGSGTVRGGTTVGNGASLAPGASVGMLSFENALTFVGGATLDWEFVNADAAGQDYDTIAGPSLYLPETGVVTLNILGLTGETGYSLEAGDSFTLFDGDVYLGGNLLAPGTDLGNRFQISDNVGWWGTWEIAAGSLVLTAVPEPGSWLLAVMGLACGLLARRRSR